MENPDRGRGLLAVKLSEITEWCKDHILLAIGAFMLMAWIGFSALVYCFEKGANGGNISGFWDSVWWGIVTMLTVGYGDRYPVTLEGRVFGGLLMCSGVLSVGVLTAKVSSIFLERALREARGVVDTKNLSDHFIVCGWKSEIHVILGHILDFNPGLDAGNLVLIANLAPSQIEELKAVPRLEKVKVIVGDFFSEPTLRRAAPERARKILVLADQTPNSAGQMPTITESDARTIMTAMTLSTVARGANVAAEILDPKMDQYLKIAHVTEIIYSREYSRLLLGNASSGTGVMNVIHELLDPATPVVLTTHPIDESMIGCEYSALREEYARTRPNTILVGVMENSGNSQQVKEAALRKAQQTPDVGKLVQNLRTVKELKFNHPVFNPAAGYRLATGCMAIVIETRDVPRGSAFV